MAEYVTQSEELRRMGTRLIKTRKLLEYLRDTDVVIGYCYSDQLKKNGEKLVLGECIKVKPVYQAFMPYDFIIVFYSVNTDCLTKHQKEILMIHELLHIGVSNSGNLTYKINQHDIEDFRSLISRYGIDWAGDQYGT